MRRLVHLLAAGILAAASPALAKGPEAPKLVTYDDAKANVTFSYPKGWGNIVLDEHGAKAGALSEDGSTRLIIEAVLEPPTGGLVGMLHRRVPTGTDHPQGRWLCRWGELSDGRHSTFCARKSERPEEYLVVGISATPSHFQLYFHQLIIKIGDSARGFRATEG